MKFSFDEAEIINGYLEQQPETPNKEAFINIVKDTIIHTEDPELVEICNNIIAKVRDFDEERYNKFITELPVENLTNY
jgi:hypothetical protein